MLSNPISSPPPSALQTRQRLHRRQRSTPAVCDLTMPAAAAAVAAAVAATQAHTPSQQPRQTPSHRRGQSLDNRRQQLQQRHERQQQQQQQRRMAAAVASSTAALEQDLQNMVGNGTNTNTGLITTQQQHDMRELQQQCTERLGSTCNAQQPPFARQSLETQSTTQPQQDSQVDAAFDFYSEPTAAATMRKSLSGSGYPEKQQDFQLFGSSDLEGFQASPATPQDCNSAAAFAAGAPSPGWQSEEETSSTRRVSRRVSNGILDRVARFEGLAVDNLPRPATPPHQNNNAYFAPTPRATPQDKLAQFERKAQLTRFSDEYDESMEETLKPQRNRSNRSSGIFEDMRQQAEAAAAMATPPRSTMLQMPMTPTDFIHMGQINTDFLHLQNSQFAAMPMPAGMQHLSPPLSQQSTPATVQDMFDGGLTDHAGLFNKARYTTQQTMSPLDDAYHPSPAYSNNNHMGGYDQRSSHRRNESVNSVASTASIATTASMSSLADMNLEETRTETGVTLDDIATYIDGPSPADGKWRCVYEGCNKRFGRKENIKSHVQTHLNDRQYQCPHCQKCFVRQHDLKRHAKIHTGVKPYPCECGNSFARHDALTRHRQRGMCIGAFDGAVRKVGKRGRPRKSRPDLEARREKSSRTRSKNQTTSTASASASTSPHDWQQMSSSPEAYLHSDHTSSSSDSSASNSPRSDHSGQLFDAHEPFSLDLDFASTMPAARHGATMNPSALVVSSAPMPGAPPSVHASPDGLPSQFAAASSLPSLPSLPSPADHLPSQFAVVSPVKSTSSHYSPHHPSTPPELTASSSPPPSSSRFFDMDPYASYDEDDSLDLSAPLGSSRCGPLGSGGLMVDAGLASSGGSLEDDMLLMKALSTEDMLAQLDNSGLSMLNTSRFDDDYALFTNSDDLLFGN